MAETTLLTKLTLKGMGCKPDMVKAQEDATKPLLLARIYGIARSLKHKESKEGVVHVAIIGEFEGVNTSTGEVYNAGVLYLPAGIHELLEAPLSKEDAEAIEFGFDIYSVTASNPIGYSYQAKPLIKPRENDALSALRNMANETVKLPAPTSKAASAKK